MAQHFATEVFEGDWIGDCNRHDIDGILAHYVAGIRLTSAFVAEFTGRAGGTI